MFQMTEKYPVGEDGVENWGTYLSAGSDSYWANITQYLKWFGYEPTVLKFLLETITVNGGSTVPYWKMTANTVV